MMSRVARYVAPVWIAIVVVAGPPNAVGDEVVTLAQSLGCWYLAAPPPPYRVFLRVSGAPPSAGIQVASSLFTVAIGQGPSGEILVARSEPVGEAGVFRMTSRGLAKVFDLPHDFVPSAILSTDAGTVYVLGAQWSVGNSFVRWSAKTGLTMTRMGGNASIIGYDLAEDGCTAVFAAGSVYRVDLCQPPHSWNVLIPMPDAGDVFFAPDNRLLVRRRGLVQVLDRRSLATLSTYPISQSEEIVGFSPDGQAFWAISSTCSGSDNTARRYDLTSGRVTQEQAIVVGGFAGDWPYFGAVQNGWRAALERDPEPVQVPLLSRVLIALLLVVIATAAVNRVS